MKSWLVWILLVFVICANGITLFPVAADAGTLDWIAMGGEVSAGEMREGLGFVDSVRARLAWSAFASGGVRFAANVLALSGFVLQALALIILTAVGVVLAKRMAGVPKARRLILWGLAVALMVMFVLPLLGLGRDRSLTAIPPELLLPGTLDQLSGKAAEVVGEEGVVWANPTSARYLAFLAPDLPLEETEHALTGAANPVIWRLRAREWDYDAVLLAGVHSEHRPLLDHLVLSPDWVVADIQPAGILFLPAKPGEGDQWPVLEEAGLDVEDSGLRSYYLARIAEQLSVLGRHGDARRFFAQALEWDPDRPDVRSLYASFLASREQFGEALEIARRVLEEHPNSAAALQVKVQAALGAEDRNSAWEAAQALERRMPNDPFSLFLVAKAANAAGSLEMESRALERLIRVVSMRGLPVANYRIYLGQAYARMGLATPAIEQWQQAVDSGTLSPAQVEYLEELRQTLLPAAKLENPLSTESPVR